MQVKILEMMVVATTPAKEAKRREKDAERLRAVAAAVSCAAITGLTALAQSHRGRPPAHTSSHQSARTVLDPSSTLLPFPDTQNVSSLKQRFRDPGCQLLVSEVSWSYSCRLHVICTAIKS